MRERLTALDRERENNIFLELDVLEGIDSRNVSSEHEANNSRLTSASSGMSGTEITSRRELDDTYSARPHNFPRSSERPSDFLYDVLGCPDASNFEDTTRDVITLPRGRHSLSLVPDRHSRKFDFVFALRVVLRL